jgi:hypothetical protein
MRASPAGKPAPEAEVSACGCQRGTCAREKKSPSAPVQPNDDGSPDFAKMTPLQKVAFHKARWDRILG